MLTKMEMFCFNTQPPEGGWADVAAAYGRHVPVSTHSRLKAAGPAAIKRLKRLQRFNTQPPEGGWGGVKSSQGLSSVSTHSRLKAAGPNTA